MRPRGSGPLLALLLLLATFAAIGLTIGAVAGPRLVQGVCFIVIGACSIAFRREASDAFAGFSRPYPGALYRGVIGGILGLLGVAAVIHGILLIL